MAAQRTFLPPLLVGRAHEQNLLAQLVAAALGGRGSLVLVGGEAGIGKTALTTERPMILVLDDLHWADAASLDRTGDVSKRAEDWFMKQPAVKAVAAPGTQVVIMSNGGFGGLHGKLASALAK